MSDLNPGERYLIGEWVDRFLMARDKGDVKKLERIGARLAAILGRYYPATAFVLAGYVVEHDPSSAELIKVRLAEILD